MLPETRYTQSQDGTSVAYQVFGQGPIDLLIVPGFVSHLEWMWEDQKYKRFLDDLSSFARLVLFDKRGTGLSDRVAGIPSLEQRMDDLRAVLDAVGCKRAVILGISEGGPMSLLFAATYPSRVTSLILYGTIARGRWAPDYPWGARGDADTEAWLEGWRREWGGPYSIDVWAPTAANDPVFRAWFAKFLRLSASPSAVVSLFRMNMAIDVRSILPAVRVPTCVIHRKDDRAISIEEGRYLASRIPQSHMVELEGEDHLWWVGDSDAIVREIRAFVIGERAIPQPNRVLSTVLFTDIVASTRQLAELGDARWRERLISHDGIARRTIERFGGRPVKSTGDGILATFDGPARGIRCALSMRDELADLGLAIRAGLHTGEIELYESDVTGLAVHMAARITSKVKSSEVWISRTLKDLVIGSDFRLQERGAFALKGMSGRWALFAVTGTGGPSSVMPFI
jgi:pimeloyl-ACP methyl ester carboxylesterase